MGLKYIPMAAEGSGKFGYKDLELDNRLDHNSDDGEQEVDTTHPFQPGAASTPYQPGDPYHGGKQMEMRTMQHKKSSLPDTSYTETPFRGEDSPLLGPDSIGDLQKESYLRQKLKKAVDTIKGNFPKAKFEKIPIRRGKKKRKCGENCCCWAVRKE